MYSVFLVFEIGDGDDCDDCRNSRTVHTKTHLFIIITIIITIIIITMIVLSPYELCFLASLTSGEANYRRLRDEAESIKTHLAQHCCLFQA